MFSDTGPVFVLTSGGALRSGYLIPLIAPSQRQRISGLLSPRGFFPLVAFLLRSRRKTTNFSPENDLSEGVSIRWCNWEGKPPGLATPSPCVEDVANLSVKASVRDMSFRDPQSFVAGEIHNHLPEWEKILTDHPKRSEFLGYLRDGVCIEDSFVPSKGSFQGASYDTKTPPKAIFPNSKSGNDFEDFIPSTISQRLKNGSVSLWGKVGFCSPPHNGMPITRVSMGLSVSRETCKKLTVSRKNSKIIIVSRGKFL